MTSTGKTDNKGPAAPGADTPRVTTSLARLTCSVPAWVYQTKP